MGKKDELIKRNNIRFENEKLSINGKAIVINDYTFLGIVNNGANAIILKAKGIIAKETVAIKIWIPSSKPDSAMQSMNEIAKMASISTINYTPNLIKYYGSGIANGYYYCIMEFLDNDCYMTLRDKLEKPMSLHERYQVLMNIVSGLRYAQENLLFHGDLHADNILINKKDNTAKIIDFGTSFRNRLYSKQRDNKMTLEIGKSLLAKELNEDLIIFYDITPEQLPQNAIRLIVKATAKIVVLLDFWKVGNVDTIVEDISLFVTMVPFFNLRLLVSILFENRNVPEMFKKLFKDKIITELFQQTMDMEFDELEKMYAEKQKRFINLCEREPRENYIYRDYHQAVLFNGPLYAKYFADDEVAVERLEIEQVIE